MLNCACLAANVAAFAATCSCNDGFTLENIVGTKRPGNADLSFCALFLLRIGMNVGVDDDIFLIDTADANAAAEVDDDDVVAEDDSEVGSSFGGGLLREKGFPPIAVILRATRFPSVHVCRSNSTSSPLIM